MKFLLMGAATTGLALAATVAHADQPATTTATAPAAKPTYGTYGFDTAGMDASVKPGDDFYEYANGTWLKNTPSPADKSN